MIKHLIIGNGEVGKAVCKVFRGKAIDTDYDSGIDKCEYMHICFPYTPNFISEVNTYKELFSPKVTIIHSSVPVGTTSQIDKAVHSPVRGVHPDLEKSLKKFMKFVGTNDKELGMDVCNVFEEHGLIAFQTTPENTEAGKLISTTYYAWNIMFEKWVYEFCQKNNLDYDVVYRYFNLTYNDGYYDMEKYHVIRPTLKHVEGKIGGHCQIPNAKLLKDFEPAKIILDKNETL